jgi:hypothetical protein
VPLEVFFELVAPYLYRAAQPYAGNLPAAQTPVDPALAHPELPAQLRNREQLHAAALLFFLRAQSSSSLPRGVNTLLELQEGALEFLEGLVVSF